MNPIEKKILRHIVKASDEYKLIEDGDKIMVCMSGGKDSFAMLHMLQIIQKRAPFSIELLAVNLDQGHPGFPASLLEEYFKKVNVPYKMLYEDTHSIVVDKIPEGKTFCSLCSRLRRGILYNAAVEHKCNKIALGHHRDDLLETLLLNIFYAGVMKTMPPKLYSDDGRNTVIRPLAYCDESWLIELSNEQQFPIIPCDLCGSQENLKRKQIKKMIAELHDNNPNVKGSIFHSMKNIKPSHMLDPVLRHLDVQPQISDDPTADLVSPSK